MVGKTALMWPIYVAEVLERAVVVASEHVRLTTLVRTPDVASLIS